MKNLSLLFLLLCTISSASAQSVSLGDYSVNLDSEVSVPVVVNDAEIVAGGIVKISFDPDIVTAKNITSGDFGNPQSLINNSEGWVKLIAADSEAVNKNKAVLAKITFRGITGGNTDILFSYAVLNDESGTLIIPEISNGSIAVSSSDLKAPELTVNYPLQGQNVSDRFITVSGTAFDNSGLMEVSVNGVPASGKEEWSAEIELVEGENSVVVVAKDFAGNEKTVKVQVFYDSGEWISWFDSRSDEGKRITTAELQEIIYYWMNDLTAGPLSE